MDRRIRWLFCWCVLSLLWPYQVLGAVEGGTQDLFKLGLEELKQTRIIVSSVSRKEQELFQAASAVCVIDQTDIKRSGLTSIPELLRLCPGMNVAQAVPQKWLVSARGFNGVYADKLLVLADGRTLYTPLFNGVHWEIQDYPLENIERIEVIRGPGATMWGANAVNGVVNIISKSTKATQGILVSAAAGSADRALGFVQKGGKISRGDVSYRVYGRRFDRDGVSECVTCRLISEEVKNAPGFNDRWRIASGGFQVEGVPNQQNNWMVQGRTYTGGGRVLTEASFLPSLEQRLYTDRHVFSGQHVLGTWKHVQSPQANWALTTYFDHTNRREIPLYSENRHTWDVDFQHRFPAFGGQDIVYGVGYHGTHDGLKPGLYVTEISPPERTESIYSAFIQDEIALRSDFHLIVGSKFERNVYTGFEVQPSGRFLWTPSPKHSVWGSVSRALRAVNRNLTDLSGNVTIFPPGSLVGGVPTPIPVLITLSGSKPLKAGRLLAYELGYRTNPIQSILLDFTAFVHVYRDLIGDHIGGRTYPPSYDHVVIPIQYQISTTAETLGFEWLGSWQVSPHWLLKAAYTHLNIQAHASDPTDSITEPLHERSAPQNQFQLHSILNLPHAFNWDMGAYYVGSLPASGSTPRVSPYIRLDVRLGWKPIQNLELSVVGQNLLKARVEEANTSDNYPPGKVQRGIYAKASLNL